MEELRNSELKTDCAETVITEVPVAVSAVSEDIKDALVLKAARLLFPGLLT